MEQRKFLLVHTTFMLVAVMLAIKNFDTLLFAFAKAVSVQPEAMLCVVGYPFNEAEISLNQRA